MGFPLLSPKDWRLAALFEDALRLRPRPGRWARRMRWRRRRGRRRHPWPRRGGARHPSPQRVAGDGVRRQRLATVHHLAVAAVRRLRRQLVREGVAGGEAEHDFDVPLAGQLVLLAGLAGDEVALLGDPRRGDGHFTLVEIAVGDLAPLPADDLVLVGPLALQVSPRPGGEPALAEGATRQLEAVVHPRQALEMAVVQ